MILTRLDGTVIGLAENNLKLLRYNIPSPSLTHYTDTVAGRSGDVFLGSDYQNRTITCEMFYKSADLDDYFLLKADINRLFATKEPFYLTFNREPGKRWKVRLNAPFSVEKFNSFAGTFTMEFITESPYAESIGDTLDPKTFDSELWQIGEGLILDETMYTHSTNTFSIYAAENGMTINPRNIPLVITYKGASNNLQIKNLTTGDTWSYTGSTVSSDTLSLDGVRSLKNGVSVFGNTNHKLITLEPGWNDFQLVGTSGSFTISFEFRFYFL